MIVSLVVLVALLPHSALVLVGAIPRRGNEPWSLVLCKFKDSDYEPRTAEWFSEWISGGNNPEIDLQPMFSDTIENYFSSVSNTIYTIKGSNVTKWLRLPWTRHEVLRMALMDPRLQSVRDRPFAHTSFRNLVFKMFDKAKQLCISFAEQNGFTLHRRKITVINMENTAVYSKDTGKVYALLPSLFSNAVAKLITSFLTGNKFVLIPYVEKFLGVLLTPKLIFSSVLTHEMIHGMNVGHSYSDRKVQVSRFWIRNRNRTSLNFVQVFPYAAPGEYDDKYDLMSTANAHMRLSTYGLSGPGLNGPHLDYLGWLPQNRIVYFGRDGRTNYTLRLSSLSVPHRLTNGWLLVMIPYDRDDPGNVYTIEHRTPVGNDMAIKQCAQGAVVVHKVHRIGQSYYSTLITHEHGEFDELTAGTEWLRFLNTNIDGSFQYIRVKVRINLLLYICCKIIDKITSRAPLSCVFMTCCTVCNVMVERVNGKSHSADLKIITTFRPVLSFCLIYFVFRYVSGISTENHENLCDTK
uniref:Peptidase_M10 domain-containing protein n=1 Tax=Angiostrongylus cantonensis TaxID=6313 RepID=A0A0K0DGD1_ANGCA